MSLVARVTCAVATVPSMHEEVDERAGQQQSPRKHAEDVRLVPPQRKKTAIARKRQSPAQIGRRKRRVPVSCSDVVSMRPACAADHGFGSRFMPHLGHFPGAFSLTSGCIGQV